MAVVIVTRGDGAHGSMLQRWTGNRVVTDWLEHCMIEEVRQGWLHPEWREQLAKELASVIEDGFEHDSLVDLR